MDGLKSVQGRQIDEFSRQQLRDSQSTIDKFTARMSELQEIVNFMNHSGEFQEVDSVRSGRLSHVPTFTSSNFKPSRDAEPLAIKACDQKKGISTVYQETFSTILLHQPTQCLHFMEKFFIPKRKVLRVVTWCNRARQNRLSPCYTEDMRFANLRAQYSHRGAHGDLWRKVRNRTETQFQLRDLQRDRQLEILTLRGQVCIHRTKRFIQGFKFRSFILTNSLLHQHFPVGK